MEFLSQNMQIIIAALAVFVILVILLAAWRTFSPRLSGRHGQRLGISEYYEIDKTRRLVLLRRDNIEHLVLLGGENDLLIESGITPGSTAASFSPSEPAPLRAPPRPPVFGDRKPIPPRPATTAAPGTPRPREEPEL